MRGADLRTTDVLFISNGKKKKDLGPGHQKEVQPEERPARFCLQLLPRARLNKDIDHQRPGRAENRNEGNGWKQRGLQDSSRPRSVGWCNVPRSFSQKTALFIERKRKNRLCCCAIFWNYLVRNACLLPESAVRSHCGTGWC